MRYDGRAHAPGEAKVDGDSDVSPLEMTRSWSCAPGSVMG